MKQFEAHILKDENSERNLKVVLRAEQRSQGFSLVAYFFFLWSKCSMFQALAFALTFVGYFLNNTKN